MKITDAKTRLVTTSKNFDKNYTKKSVVNLNYELNDKKDISHLCHPTIL